MNNVVKKPIPKLTTISWSAALGSDEPDLFLVNRSSPKQHIVMSVTTRDGNVAVTLPSTWIPVNMAVKASRAEILNSASFRTLAEAGSVAIVDTNQARELFKTHKLALTEQRRLNQGGGSSEISLDEQEAPEETAKSPVNVAVIDLVSNINEGHRSPSDTCALLSNLELTKQDVAYILQKCDDSEVREFAANCE